MSEMKEEHDGGARDGEARLKLKMETGLGKQAPLR